MRAKECGSAWLGLGLRCDARGADEKIRRILSRTKEYPNKILKELPELLTSGSLKQLPKKLSSWEVSHQSGKQVGLLISAMDRAQDQELQQKGQAETQLEVQKREQPGQVLAEASKTQMASWE